ncbi:MAG: hypothetical protein RLZZ24_144, partial [Pseudomonadota bacterium]
NPARHHGSGDIDERGVALVGVWRDRHVVGPTTAHACAGLGAVLFARRVDGLESAQTLVARSLAPKHVAVVALWWRFGDLPRVGHLSATAEFNGLQTHIEACSMCM